MALPPGSTLGYYVIRSLIGAGGMGEVYLARDRKLARSVALKILPAEFSTNQERMRRFVQEAQSAAALNHPSIAHIYEIGEADGTHFIAMEYVDGETLREKIHRAKAPLQELLRCLTQVAEGLVKAHAAGIVHRDLKPDNIMISRDGYAKILDFGLAKLIEPQKPYGAGDAGSSEAATAMQPQHSEPGVVMGTVGYMSPEQAQGRVQAIDHRSDIFSFGCILFETATRRKAFEGKDALDSLHKIVHAPAPQIREINSSAPEELQRIVRRCLAKDPEKRYQAIKDVAIELEELRQQMQVSDELGGSGEMASEVGAASETASARVSATVTTQPEAARPTSSAEYLVTQIRQHKAGATAALLVVLLAFGGIGYAVYNFAAPAKQRPAHFQNVTIKRLTNEGTVGGAVISPDGKYLAYSLDEKGKLSLWTKHLGTGSQVQIVPPADAQSLSPQFFSPDGGYIYYLRDDEQVPQGALYQIPVLGGVAKKLVTDISSEVSPAADGKRLAFTRFNLKTKEQDLIIADVDGANERSITTRRQPDYFQCLSWSPDGKSLAIVSSSTERGYDMNLAAFSVADGSMKPLSPFRWVLLDRVAWLADGSGLLAAGWDQYSRPPQIWFISTADGEVRPVTNDVNGYSSYTLSPTADSTALVAVQEVSSYGLWVAPAGDAGRARAITSRKNTVDGYSLSWTPDGRIVFGSNAGEKYGVWTMKSDGTDIRPLTEADADNVSPAVSPDGQTIVYASIRNSRMSIWRMNAEGGDRKQLTDDKAFYDRPTISPDGRWVIYISVYIGGWKAPIDGGEATKLTDKSLMAVDVSPDEKLLAFSYAGEDNRPRVAVMPFEGGAILKTFEPISLSLFNNPQIRWSPDGRAIDYIATRNGVSNIWRQPLDGGPPKQITDFKSLEIIAFAWSRDGKSLALSRGEATHDVVLISSQR